jgi:DNA-directed RNA polymerase subunit E'/Rpb7
MLSLDKIKKGISDISGTGGIGSIRDSVNAGVDNIRYSVSAGVGNMRDSVRAGIGNIRDSVRAGVGSVRSGVGSVRAGLGKIDKGGRGSIFNATSLFSQSAAKQTGRPGKMSLYVKNIITKKIAVPVKYVGININFFLKQILNENFEGKCSAEGYVKYDSCKIITYSCGTVTGNLAIFTVVIEYLVCNPSQGMRISCEVKNITNAGIIARIDDSKYSPINIFIARDHHYNIPYFSELKEGDSIMIKVIGNRFELNDKFVSVLGKLELMRERESRDSIRHEIERSQKEKGKGGLGLGLGLGLGALSTVIEESTGLKSDELKKSQEGDEGGEGDKGDEGGEENASEESGEENPGEEIGEENPGEENPGEGGEAE